MGQAKGVAGRGNPVQKQTQFFMDVLRHTNTIDQLKT